MVLCVYIGNERGAGGTWDGDDTWVGQSRAGGAGEGCGSFTVVVSQLLLPWCPGWGVLSAPDGMELLHSGATQEKSPQACPHYHKRDRCFPLPSHTGSSNAFI